MVKSQKKDRVVNRMPWRRISRRHSDNPCEAAISHVILIHALVSFAAPTRSFLPAAVTFSVPGPTLFQTLAGKLDKT